VKSLAVVIAAGLLAAGNAARGEESESRPWSISATAYAYFVPDEPDFVMAIVPADVRLLHVEARYNYEGVRSGSAFIGVNARWGHDFKLVFTPMFGGVVGVVDGVVPALRLTATWWKLELTTESEYVVDLGDSDASFYYNWTELGILPLDWLRAGVVIQRNKVFHNQLDIQRGLFLSGTFRFATLTLYELNLFWTTPTWVIAMGLTF
jgi:hypothetical protein